MKHLRQLTTFSALLVDSTGLSDLLGPQDPLFLKHLGLLFTSNKPKTLRAVCRAVLVCLRIPNDAFPLPDPSLRSSSEKSNDMDEVRTGKSRKVLMDQISGSMTGGVSVGVLHRVLPLLDILNPGSDMFLELWQVERVFPSFAL